MKVTYLFGAGASAEQLPVVEQINSRLKVLIEELTKEIHASWTTSVSIPDLTQPLSILLTQLIDDLSWLYYNSLQHASVDTFAKKLFLKYKSDNLNRLRIALSVFFIIEQTIKSVDQRYDSFFASILNRNIHDFPKDVRIISWNYDYQFEKAFANFSDDDKLANSEKLLNIITNFSRHANPEDGFCILKLNGTTKLYRDSDRHQGAFHASFQSHFNTNVLIEILQNYDVVKHKPTFEYYSGLSFAWETSLHAPGNIVSKTILETSSTEILVVIGYSFPYFNREIDKGILQQMKSLKKVYFQAPNPDDLKERFKTLRPDLTEDKLILKKEYKQFLFPNELT